MIVEKGLFESSFKWWVDGDWCVFLLFERWYSESINVVVRFLYWLCLILFYRSFVW